MLQLQGQTDNNQPTQALRVVFLGFDDPTGRYIFGRLSKTIVPVKTLNIQWAPSKNRKKKSLLKKLANYPGRVTRDRLAEARLKTISQHNDYQSVEFPNSEPVLSRLINSKATAARLRALRPDILLVCGAPILKPHIFDIPTITTINIHFGISSAYRGENTIFWPIKEGQFEDIGATVHKIDAGVDTGDVLIEYYPEVSPGDDEISLELKIAQGLVEPISKMLLELDQSTDGQLTGSAPKPGGKTVLKRDRGLLNSMITAAKIRLGLLKFPEIPERINSSYQIQ